MDFQAHRGCRRTSLSSGSIAMRQKSLLLRVIGLGTWTVLLALALATLLRWRGRSNELCGKVGDDGLRKAAYRGGCRACQNLSRRAIRHERDYQHPSFPSALVG